MKAPDFSYCRPASVDEVCALLARHEGDARILAGGQSLMATLNLRLSAPKLLIDINRIDVLRGIALDEERGEVRIGALARHVEVAESSIVARHVPLVEQAMRHVAHPAIRNRGTTCGSLALADPAAEMPACALALDATLVLQSDRDGRRSVPASEFFLGLYETARREDELIVEVRFPCSDAADTHGFDELSRRHGDFAMVGVCVGGRRDDDAVRDLRLTVFGTDAVPVRCAAGSLSQEDAWSDAMARQIASAACTELAPDDAPFGSARIRRLQAGALIRRVLLATFPVTQTGWTTT